VIDEAVEPTVLARHVRDVTLRAQLRRLELLAAWPHATNPEKAIGWWLTRDDPVRPGGLLAAVSKRN